MQRLVTAHYILSKRECRELIDRLERSGFEVQHSGNDGSIIRTRSVFEDPNLADQLWSRLSQSVRELVDLYDNEFNPEPAVHRRLTDFRAVGCNEMLRCYKYRVGEQFRRHEDFAHEWNKWKRTFLTVLIYLNDDFEGGETEFDEAIITPSTGIAAMFPHELMHAGCPVKTGTKYTLRSDIIFACERE